METRRGSAPGGMKARPGAPRCSAGQFRSRGYFIPSRPFFASENVWKIRKEMGKTLAVPSIKLSCFVTKKWVNPRNNGPSSPYLLCIPSFRLLSTAISYVTCNFQALKASLKLPQTESSRCLKIVKLMYVPYLVTLESRLLIKQLVTWKL